MRKIRGLLAALFSVCLIIAFNSMIIRADGEVATLTHGSTVTPCESLYDAVEAAVDGDTITLLDDITLTTTLTIDKAITFDTNGKTITGASNNGVINITSSGVTVTGGGTITGSNTSYVVSVAPSTTEAVTLDGISVLNTGAIAIQVGYVSSTDRGSVYITDCDTVGSTNAINVSGANCDVYLSGGNHYGKTAGKVLEVVGGDTSEENVCRFVVTGDTRIGMPASDSAYPVRGMDADTCPYAGFHYVTEKKGTDTYWLITNDPQYTDNSTVVIYEATVEDENIEWYLTLEEAIAAAGEDQTVVLQTNFNAETVAARTITVTKKVTINMNGKSIIAEADSGVIPFVTDSNNADLTLFNESGAITIKGDLMALYAKRGAITIEFNTGRNNLQTCSQDAGTVVGIIDGTVSITGRAKMITFSSCSTFIDIEGTGSANISPSNLNVTVSGTALKIGDGAVEFNTSTSYTLTAGASPAIQIENGTLTAGTLNAGSTSVATGLQITGSAVVNWANGSITAGETAVICAGNGAQLDIGATIRGGTSYGIVLYPSGSSAQADILIHSATVSGGPGALFNGGYPASDIMLAAGTYSCTSGTPFDETTVTIASGYALTKQSNTTWVIAGAANVGHSLTLEGDIGLNYYFELPADAAGQTLNATVSVNGGAETAVTVQPLDPPRTEGGHTYTHRVKFNVAPKDYDDEITVNLYSSNSSTRILRASNTYSVKAYCQATTGTGALGDLISATQTYCACAAAYFDGAAWPSGVPASASIDPDMVSFNPSEASRLSAYLADHGIPLQLYGSSLVLETTTEYRIYFRITDPEADISRIGIKVDGVSTQLVRVQGTNYCYVAITNIASSHLSDKHNIVFDGISNATRVTPIDYINQNLQGNDNDLKRLLVALWNYYNASAAYFGT